MAKIPAKKSIPQGSKPLVKEKTRAVKRTPSRVQIVNATVKKPARTAAIAKISKKTTTPKKVSKVSKTVQIPVVLDAAERKGKISVKINDKTITRSKISAPEVHEQIQKPTKKIVVRTPMLPAKLSPFRFPMLSPKYLSSVARVAGVFFVMAGALFSLVNLQGSTVAQRAEIISSGTLSTETQITQTYPAITTDTSTGSIDTTPGARIVLETTNSLLSGTVPMMVTVPLAAEVKVLAVNKVDNQVHILGNAVNVDATTWRFYWSTPQFPDGEYTLKLVIKNQYGVYEYVDGTPRILENYPEAAPTDVAAIEEIAPSVETTATTSIQTVSTTTASSSPVALKIDVSLSILEASPLHDTVALKVFVANATEVRLYAREIKTLTFHYVGRAVHQSGDEWRFDWDTNSVPDGDFTVQAKATVDGTFGYSPHKTISVDNIKDIATATTSVLQQETSTTTEIQPLKPSIALSLSRANPLVGFTDIVITTSPVNWVEVYAVSKNALSPYFLGLAQKKTSTEWKFSWDTKQTPNGDYYVYARVKSDYGFTEGSRVFASIRNEVFVAFTEEQEKSIDTINTVSNELVQTTDNLVISKDAYPAPTVVYVQSVDSFIETVEIDDSSKNSIADLLNDFNTELMKKIELLATAIRNGDTVAVERVRRETEDLKNDVLKKIAALGEKSELVSSAESYVTELIFELQELTTKNESILKDRLGENLTKDSDKDDVSDYDEINLYHTNPFAADTDGDGYIDSVEIRLGYNPHDSSSEALVAYQSAKETGVVREDILVVESITSLTNDIPAGEESSVARAIISGKGLPNSFVTLYVYSTPIVVTVKSDSDGSWSYIFDKELEEGTHEVYAGITDNAGRIVAKSKPLPFVKTAEAFTDTSASLGETVVTQPSLIAGNNMLLVGSIAIAALGLVLILLGLHVSRKEKDPLELLYA